jgi:hypothetical protein
MFTCNTDDKVAFYVGNLLLGSVNKIQALVTPLDLVSTSSAVGTNNPTVTNIVRFLMSISSTLPDSGKLTIDKTVFDAIAAKAQTIDFASATTTLGDLIAAVKSGATIYTDAQAKAHLEKSVNALFAGDYSGSFGGSASGTWSITISATGVVTGTATDSGAITGNMIASSGTASNYAFTGTSGDVTWTGTLNLLTKQFSGTWNGGGGFIGTFTGKAAAASTGALTPTSGAPGTSIIIDGTNLSTFTKVLFTGSAPSFPFVEVAPTTQSATRITATVPATLAAGSYTVTVTRPGEEVTVGTFSVSGTSGGGGGGVTTCISAHYSVPVHAPTASELAAYAKTYLGNVGNFGPNIGDAFVSTGNASFVLDAAGGLTYNGATKLVTSMCLENTPTTGAPLYIEMQSSDHVDFFTDGGFTGVLTNGASFNVVRGGSCTTTCGTGTGTGTGTTTPTVTSFAPNTGAVGTSVSITGTNLGRLTPAPLVKFGTTNAGGPYSNVTATNVTFTVPAGLAAGNYSLTVSNFDGSNSVAAGTFTVTAAPVTSTATGMTAAPAANGLTSFPNAVPAVRISGTDRTLTYKKVSATDDGFDYFDIGHAVVSGGTYLNIDLRVGNAITINGSPATSFVSHTLFCTLIPAPTPTGTALCSTKGIVFDKTTGSVAMTDTLLTRSVVVNGSFSFTPF